jgi:hypothetical protein
MSNSAKTAKSPFKKGLGGGALSLYAFLLHCSRAAHSFSNLLFRSKPLTAVVEATLQVDESVIFW